MDMYNLSKAQKKICRQLINTALQRQCADFIERLSDEVAKAKQNDKTPSENYIRLYKFIDKFDDIIAETYNDMSATKYIITVASLYSKGVLTNDDISALDADILTTLRHILNLPT